MQPQRRVSLPAPARTTHMNGGPRLRAGTPLPPFRASVARTGERGGGGRAPDTAGSAARDEEPRSARDAGLSSARDAGLSSARDAGLGSARDERLNAAAVGDDGVPLIADAIVEPDVLNPDVGGPATEQAIVERDAVKPDVGGPTAEDAMGQPGETDPIGRNVRPYVPPAIVEESPAFPMDAFIIPEGTARLPCGVGERGVRTITADTDADRELSDSQAMPRSADVPVSLVDTAPLSVREEQAHRPRSASLREQRAHDVADRLEALATQLRHHGYEVLAQKSVRGDALDALLAGVIAGYLVAAE